jgi:hypothetical protein
MGTGCMLLAALVVASTGGERVAETTGSVLVLEHGRLGRERAGVRAELGCTDERGPGLVLDVAPDPGGLTFVAAERGLFLIGPFVDVLDPVELGDGAPRGRPASLHVDEARRVWVATESAVGVIDPSFHWGRALAADELPGAGPYRLTAHEGALVLSGSAGTRSYVPDHGAGPRITRLRIDGSEVPEDVRLERAPGGDLRVEAAGEARGGASFRYRFDRHHVWHALPHDGVIALPHPGAHVLELVALDQDLRRSPPRAVRLSIPYPPTYDARVVVGAVLAGAALACAAFVLGARATPGRAHPLRALVSTGVLVALTLQVIAGSVPHAKGWPFVGFGMYTRAYSEDELVFDERIVGLRRDGSELDLRPESAGLAIDEFWDVGRPLFDGGAPALREFLERWERRHPGASLAGLQLQARRARLTRAGSVQVAPLVLAHYREDAGG